MAEGKEAQGCMGGGGSHRILGSGGGTVTQTGTL